MRSFVCAQCHVEYYFKGEGVRRTPEEMIAYYEMLMEKYPILSIEDGLGESDWEGWRELTGLVVILGGVLLINLAKYRKGRSA